MIESVTGLGGMYQTSARAWSVQSWRPSSWRTSVPQHGIRLEQAGRRDRQTEGLGRREIDDQREVPRRLDRPLGGLGPLQALVHVGCGAPPEVTTPGPIGHKAPGLHAGGVLQQRPTGTPGGDGARGREQCEVRPDRRDLLATPGRGTLAQMEAGHTPEDTVATR